MVVVDVEISCALQLDIESPVLGQLRQHVVQEAQAAADLAAARSVQPHQAADGGLLRLPPHFPAALLALSQRLQLLLLSSGKCVLILFNF